MMWRPPLQMLTKRFWYRLRRNVQPKYSALWWMRTIEARVNGVPLD